MASPLDTTDKTDRILLGACAAAWLVALGAAVAAVVALVRLGHGHAQATGSSDTPWLLYAIIGVSVVVIAVAIPLLLRARALAGGQQTRPATPSMQAERASGSSYPITPVVVSDFGRPDSGRPDGSASDARIEQVWLRHIAGVVGTIGVATAAIAIATYLMATDSNIAAWCVYGVAGAVTAAMVALPIVAFRQLDALTA